VEPIEAVYDNMCLAYHADIRERTHTTRDVAKDQVLLRNVRNGGVVALGRAKVFKACSPVDFQPAEAKPTV